MHILYVTTIDMTMGFFKSYIGSLIDAGHTVDIACSVLQPDRLNYYREKKCKIYDVPFSRNPADVKNLSALQHLREIVKKKHYDIVHCHTPVAAFITRLACMGIRKTGTKVIYTAHGFHFFSGAKLRNWLMYYPAEYIMAHFTDALITINKEDYGRALKMAAKKVYYVPGVGIDTEKFNVSKEDRVVTRRRIRREFGIPEGATVLLSVGELSSRKNHNLAIDALFQLNNKDVYYLVCGMGCLKECLKESINAKGLSERVILAGFRSGVVDFYAASDIFLFPSLQEGLPVALMEAMASGLPVICSNIRGSSDLITDNVNGCLAELTAESFAEKIDQLIRDPERAMRYAEASEEKISQYSLPVIEQMMDRIYDEVLAEK